LFLQNSICSHGWRIASVRQDCFLQDAFRSVCQNCFFKFDKLGVMGAAHLRPERSNTKSIVGPIVGPIVVVLLWVAAICQNASVNFTNHGAQGKAKHTGRDIWAGSSCALGLSRLHRGVCLDDENAHPCEIGQLRIVRMISTVFACHYSRPSARFGS
jgi:hypothetical protein